MTAARAGLYLRRGASVTPGILTLDEGALSFDTDEGRVFSAPVAQVSVDFTRFGTLVVSAGGHRYALVAGAFAGVYARPFSRAQLAVLADAEHASGATSAFREGAMISAGSSIVGDLAKLAGNMVGSVASLAGDATGIVRMSRAQSASFAFARAVAERLAAEGVRVRMLGTTYAASQLFLAAILIPAFLAFGVGVALVVFSLANAG